MMKEKNQLDELFRSKLNDFEQEPPSYVWSRIQEKQTSEKRRRAFLLWKVSGVAAALLIAFLLGWQLQHSQKDLSPRLTNKEIPEPVVSPTPGQARIAESQPDVIDQDMTSEKIQNANVHENPKTGIGNKFASQEELQLARQVPNGNQTNASKSHEKIDQRLVENRNQNNDQLQLLRLLNIKLDHSFDNKQLAVVGQRPSFNSRLSNAEQALVDENAKLLTSNQENERSGGWQVGAMLTPGYNVNQGSQDKLYASNMAIPGSKEDVQVGGGISLEYKTGKRWSIQSGVYYNKLDQSSSNQPYRSSDALYDLASGGFAASEVEFFNTAISVKSGEMLMNTTAGVVAIDNLPSNTRLSNSFDKMAENSGVLLTQTDFEQNFEYIEIPLILRYQLIDAAFDLQLLGGVNASVLIGNDAYVVNQSGKERIGSTRDMNSVNYSTSIGFGMGYALTKNLGIRVEPQLKYFLGSLSNNSNVTFKPYTVGVSTGLSYQF